LLPRGVRRRCFPVRKDGEACQPEPERATRRRSAGSHRDPSTADVGERPDEAALSSRPPLERKRNGASDRGGSGTKAEGIFRGGF